MRFTAERFRNLNSVVFNPSTGMNIICGENAQGKTNLLEAIYVLSNLKSFRTRQLSDVLRFGEANALLQAEIRSAGGKHNLLFCVEENGKQALLDRKKVNAVQYLGTMDVFTFSYPLLEVIRGGPEERRKFLDRSVAMSKHGYLALLLNYHRALKQKNALLSRLQKGEIPRREGVDQISSFNQQLLEHGLEIVHQRTDYLDMLQQLLNQKQQLFFEKNLSLSIGLRSSFAASAQHVRALLDRVMDKEIQRGMSLVGVHRDEIRMEVHGRELRRYGSSGQHRAFLLLLVLAQLQLYEEWRRQKPVLLLDDLDAELDRKKVHAFLEEIKDRYQTMISSSRSDLFSNAAETRLFEIENGNLLERN